MSNQPERPWTEEEKYTLLTEILKEAGVPSAHLVKMIKDFRISPNWGDIPLPPGRSLNSCQLAFYGMCQQHAQPSMNMGSFPHAHHESPTSSAAYLEGSSLRKRPLFPSDKPHLAPRAIQPRPPANAGSFSSGSGASAHLPSSFENLAGSEPPRKRGRPSKAETERRKTAAEARGETYPPPRRSVPGRLKHESVPISPAEVEHPSPSISSSTNAMSPDAPKHEIRHEPPRDKFSTAVAPIVDGRTRIMPDIPDRDTGPPIRELPRPDARQMLPSPQELQLGPRETILPRMSTGERPFEPFLSREMPLGEGSRRIPADPTSQTPHQPSLSGPEVPSGTTAEKRTE